MKKKLSILMSLMLVAFMVMPTSIGAWSNLRYDEQNGRPVDNFHEIIFGGSGHYQYQSGADYSADDMGTYGNYGNHDYLLDRALYWIDTDDNGALDFSVLSVIESHEDWDIALSHTDNPDYDYGNWGSHVNVVNDDPGALWAGYAGGENVYKTYGGPHFAAKMLDIYIAYAKTYKQTGNIADKDKALEALGSLMHIVGDYSNPMHTANNIAYNHNANKNLDNPTITEKKAGYGGPEMWYFDYGSGLTSVHSEYEYTSSQFDVLDHVNNYMPASYTPQTIDTTNITMTEYLETVLKDVNEGFGLYSNPRVDYTYEVDYATDTYDMNFPTELRNSSVTYAQDGYETTPNIGAQYKDLLDNYYKNLLNGTSDYGQDGYDAHIMDITIRVTEYGSKRMADLLNWAEEQINDGTAVSEPVVAIVGWQDVDLGLSRNITGLANEESMDLNDVKDFIGFAVDPTGNSTFEWFVNGVSVGSGTPWVHSPEVAYSSRNGTGSSWNTGETNGTVFMGYTFDTTGDYTITLKATDANGVTTSDSITVHVYNY